MPLDMNSRSALVIIDLQRGLLDGQAPPYDGKCVVERAMSLIKRARQSETLVVFVQHYGPAGNPIEQGARAWELADGLDPQPDDMHIQKSRPSIFFNTGLESKARDRKIDRLILAGMKTQYCIDTSCRIGNELGFKMVLAQDAHTTVDGPDLSAEKIIDDHNDLLGGPFAEVLPAEQIALA